MDVYTHAHAVEARAGIRSQPPLLFHGGRPLSQTELKMWLMLVWFWGSHLCLLRLEHLALLCVVRTHTLVLRLVAIPLTTEPCFPTLEMLRKRCPDAALEMRLDLIRSP